MIKGEKIYLRAMEPEDMDAMYVWENDPEVWHVSNTYIPFSRHFLKQFISNSNNDIFTDKQLRLMIILNENEEFDAMHRRAGTGILIDKQHRQQGYAIEALELSKKYAFNTLNLHQLFAHITMDNEPSLNIFQKAGFKISGTKNDWLISGNTWKHVYFLQLISTT